MPPASPIPERPPAARLPPAPAPAAAVDALDERLRQGDPRALADLVERERERLLRTVRLRLDPRLARRLSPEDVLQEAFLAARTRISHYAGDGFKSPYTWLRTVLLQTMIDLHRHHCGAQKRDAGREIAVAPGANGASTRMLAAEISGTMPTPSAAAMRKEAKAGLEAALDQLSATDREIIALRHFEDLANEEVAETLGIQPKAASIRYVRALRRLGDLLRRAGLSFGDLHVRR
jgi:RNA polymerase sigma-70 factor (ECF subfamily)